MYGDKTLATTSLQGTCAHEYTHLTHGHSLTRHISDAQVRAVSGCPPVSHMLIGRRLRFFGHIACSAPNEDHHRAVAAAILKLPPDWKRPREDPVTRGWLRAIESDLKLLNVSQFLRVEKASSPDHWHSDCRLLRYESQSCFCLLCWLSKNLLTVLITGSFF